MDEVEEMPDGQAQAPLDEAAAARAVDNGWQPGDSLRDGEAKAGIGPVQGTQVLQGPYRPAESMLPVSLRPPAAVPSEGSSRAAGVAAAAGGGQPGQGDSSQAKGPDTTDAERPHWEYSQSSGELTHVDEDGNRTLVGTGYAGKGEGLNNPDLQDKKDTGPITQGTYTIGPQQDNDKLKSSLQLTPDSANVMYGRSDFLIHGPHANDKQDSSKGCPVFSKNIRDRIGSSGHSELRVTR